MLSKKPETKTKTTPLMGSVYAGYVRMCVELKKIYVWNSCRINLSTKTSQTWF